MCWSTMHTPDDGEKEIGAKCPNLKSHWADDDVLVFFYSLCKTPNYRDQLDQFIPDSSVAVLNDYVTQKLTDLHKTAHKKF